MKDKIRISKRQMDNKKASNAVDQWYHLECFITNKTELGFTYKAEE